MTRAALSFVTDFADQAVVLPVAVAVLAALALLGWRRAALAWGVGIPSVLGVTAVLKLVVMACGVGMALGLASPSGHTAAAAAVYGALPALMIRERRPGLLAAAACAALVAVGIGLTRIGLGVHSPADIGVGGAVGVIGAVCLRVLAGPRPPLLPWPRLLAPALLAMLAFHGHRFDSENNLRWAALRIWPLTLCRGG